MGERKMRDNQDTWTADMVQLATSLLMMFYHTCNNEDDTLEMNCMDLVQYYFGGSYADKSFDYVVSGDLRGVI